MKLHRGWMASALAVCFLASSGAAQFPGMPGPPMVRGVWSPVVGAGAAYEVVDRRGVKTEMEIAIVGSETFQGQPAHWMEIAMKTKEGDMVMKQLVAIKNKEIPVLRMIMQRKGDEPIEMSMEMMGMMNRGGQRPTPKSDAREGATLVGTETITVPAGTFTCEHFKNDDGDFWTTEKISPWGLVKVTGKDNSMTLLRTVTDAKTKIVGTPRKFDMGEMMRRPPQE